MIRLDTLLANVPPGLPLLAVKIDVQGHNINVIRGGGGYLAKRALIVYTECTMEKTLNGKVDGAAIWGNADDICPNIVTYMKAQGFSYVTGHVGAPDYTIADLAFVTPQYLDVVKICIDQSGGKWKLDQMVETPSSPMECMMTKLHAHLGLSR